MNVDGTVTFVALHTVVALIEGAPRVQGQPSSPLPSRLLAVPPKSRPRLVKRSLDVNADEDVDAGDQMEMIIVVSSP